MINLTNGRLTFMGEGWIKPFDEHAIESRPMTSVQYNEQIPLHLRDLRPYITPEEMSAREYGKKSMQDVNDVTKWG